VQYSQTLTRPSLLWDMDAPRRWHMEMHDDGVWLWWDDAGSIGVEEA